YAVLLFTVPTTLHHQHKPILFPYTTIFRSEIAYITIHLLGTKMLNQTNAGEEVVEQVLDNEMNQLVMLALDKIEEELNLDIKHDQELIMGLGLHLKPAINRYKYGMNF